MTDTEYRCDGAGAEALAKQLSADERLQPGDSGYWEVWGAGTFDVIAGDIIVTFDNGTLVCEEIASCRNNTVQMVFTTVSDKAFSLGHLFRQFKVFRLGTHNMLANSV